MKLLYVCSRKIEEEKIVDIAVDVEVITLILYYVLTYCKDGISPN